MIHDTDTYIKHNTDTDTTLTDMSDTSNSLVIEYNRMCCCWIPNLCPMRHSTRDSLYIGQ